MPIPLEERLAIQDLLVRYTWYVDFGCTEAEFMRLFTEDALIDSPLSGKYENLEGLKRFYVKNAGTRSEVLTRHFLTNCLVEGEGNQATMKAYFMIMMTPPKPQHPRRVKQTEFVYTGGYDCEAVKVKGEWRLKRRTVTTDSYP